MPEFMKLIGEKFPTFARKGSRQAKVNRSIGLNIGRSSLTACEVVFDQDVNRLERCARVPIDSEQDLSKQIQEFVKAIGFQSKRVNLSLKGQGVVIRFLNFPKMAREEFSSSIQFEAEKYLPFNLSEVVLDYHINDRKGGGGDEHSMHVVLVAARRTEIERLMKLVKSSELIVNSIDVDVFACVNSLFHTIPDAQNQVVGIIDFGATDTTLCVSNKSATTFSRDIAFGGHDMTEMLRRKLNVSFEEAAKIQHQKTLSDPVHVTAVQESLDRLFQELKLSLNYFFNQHQDVESLDTFYICGGFSQQAQLSEMLQAKLGIPVKTWNAAENLMLDPNITDQAIKPLIPYLPVSMGLALRTS